MNKREACEWVHARLIVDEMPFDELVAAFTALVGHVPKEPDRREGLFRRCHEVVMSLTGASEPLSLAAKRRVRSPSMD
jgi:hypothetical protein